MSIQYVVNLTGNPVEVFDQYAAVYEILSIDKCGKCSSPVIPIVRTVESKKSKKPFVFRELACTNQQCRARLGIGLEMSGDKLFPQRKNIKTGVYYPNGGWKVYTGPPAEPDEDEDGDENDGGEVDKKKSSK